MANKIKVTIVEDHDMTRMGLSFALSNSGVIEVVGTSADGQEGVDQALELRPDLVVMDIGVPTIDGIEATRKIKNSVPEIKVLMNTSRDNDDDILDSFAAGADGYIMKGANKEQLVSAITAVSQGTAWLDPAIAKMVLSNIQRHKPVENKSATNSLKYKEYNLTKREYEVLCLIADGLDNQEIADKLVVSLSTARAHVHNVLGKLYVANKHQATVLAVKEGLV